jgi:hypothetical protein
LDQTLFEEDGSYWKVNTVTLSYNVNRAKLKRFGISSARLYASVANLFMWQRYSGPNAENVSALGRDQSNGYPMRRSVNLGMNVQF